MNAADDALVDLLTNGDPRLFVQALDNAALIGPGASDEALGAFVFGAFVGLAVAIGGLSVVGDHARQATPALWGARFRTVLDEGGGSPWAQDAWRRPVP